MAHACVRTSASLRAKRLSGPRCRQPAGLEAHAAMDSLPPLWRGDTAFPGAGNHAALLCTQLCTHLEAQLGQPKLALQRPHLHRGQNTIAHTAESTASGAAALGGVPHGLGGPHHMDHPPRVAASTCQVDHTHSSCCLQPSVTWRGRVEPNSSSPCRWAAGSPPRQTRQRCGCGLEPAALRARGHTHVSQGSLV